MVLLFNVISRLVASILHSALQERKEKVKQRKGKSGINYKEELSIYR